MVEGKLVDDANHLTRHDILNAIAGLPSRKQHAAALAIEALRTALKSFCV